MTKESDVVADIVADALGERPIAVEHVPTLEDSHVFRLQLTSGLAYFKSEHEGHPIAAAMWAYQRAAAAGVPVPQVLHLDLTRERWPEEFAITTAVDGTDLQHDPLEGTQLIHAIEGYGEVLRRLHTIATQRFGDLDFHDPASSEPVGRFTDHAASVRASSSWGLPYLVGNDLVSRESAEQIEEILARHEELFRAPDHGVLNHGDAGLDHLFLERENFRITGLIDFEPVSADPAVDLAIFAYHYPDLSQHLLDGYGIPPDDIELRLEVYGLIRAVGSARWEHERDFDIAQPLREIERRTAHLEQLLR